MQVSQNFYNNFILTNHIQIKSNTFCFSIGLYMFRKELICKFDAFKH